MGRWETEEMDPKSQLAREICSLSSAFASCTHRRRSSPRKPTFVDWYLILMIEDNAGVDLVRRRYRHLALQLHPDKNKDPQAEIAFKLVSEAYACLSDEARRRAFDSERLASACQECSGRLHHDSRREPPRGNNAEEGAAAEAAAKHMRTRRILRALEEVRSRLREDAKVIENCLRARKASRRESSPIFDPSDCLLYPDYPHHPSLRVPKEIWYIHTSTAGHAPSYKRCSRRGRCESPVYEIGAESNASRYSKFRFS